MITNGQVKQEVKTKYAFYPGCVSRGGCPELYEAVTRCRRSWGWNWTMTCWKARDAPAPGF